MKSARRNAAAAKITGTLVPTSPLHRRKMCVRAALGFVYRWIARDKVQVERPAEALVGQVFERNVLRTLPQDKLAERFEMFAAMLYREEMIAGQLSHLAREA